MAMETTRATTGTNPVTTVSLVLAWAAVGLPLLWGVAQTIKKTFALFSS